MYDALAEIAVPKNTEENRLQMKRAEVERKYQERVQRRKDLEDDLNAGLSLGRITDKVLAVKVAQGCVNDRRRQLSQQSPGQPPSTPNPSTGTVSEEQQSTGLPPGIEEMLQKSLQQLGIYGYPMTPKSSHEKKPEVESTPEEKTLVSGGLRLIDQTHGGHPSPYVDDRNRVFGTMTYTMSDGSSTFKVSGSQQYKEGSWSVTHTWQAPSVLPSEGETVTIKVSASANVKLPGHSVTLRPGAGLSGNNCSIYAGKTGNGTEVPGRTVDCNFVVRKNVSEASFVVVNGPHSHTYKYARQ